MSGIPLLAARVLLAAMFLVSGHAAFAFLHTQALLKDIAVAGGLVALAVAGAGPLSLDRLLRR